MARKKTHEEFVKEVFERVGDEYSVLSEYKGARIQVWMRHNSEKCSYHEYPVTPNNFLNNGRRCPKCFGTPKKTTEQFKQEVFELVGEEYEVISEYVNNKTEVWMRHNNKECDYYEFPVMPNSFLRLGTRCPKCAGNMRRDTNYFKSEVFKLVGNEYDVLGEYKNAHTEILMRHNKCGYKWDVTPDSFKRGTRCPKCSKRVRKDTDYFKREVFERVGNEYEVLGEYENAKTEILMKHNECGKSFPITPNNFLHGRRCPYCQESRGEKRIVEVLNELNITYERQYKFDDCKCIRPLPFDFAIFNKNNDLVALIEYQGEQHYEPIEVFGGEEKYIKTKTNDLIKKKYCEKKNIKLIEIPYWQFDNIENIIRQHFSDLIN